MVSVVFRFCNRSIFNQNIKKVCTAAIAATNTDPVQNHQWHIMSAICLERKPVVCQEMVPIEKTFSALLKQIEDEQSLKSDHELREIEDKKFKKKLEKGDEDIDLDIAAKQTAKDFEYASYDELQAFKKSSVITEADETNDYHSLDRKLRNHLLLIIKQKLGNDYQWILPQTIRNEDENLREAAERIMKETCGDNLQCVVMGNAPVGYYKYKYPKAARVNGKLGAKLFFFKVQVRGGTIDEDIPKRNSDTSDYCWATRSELQEKLQPDYYKTVKSFLIDEIEET